MVTSTDEPPNAGPVPLAWPSLAFHPLGLYDLRRRLGKLPKEPGIYDTFIDHFKYSDLAWFAPGLAKKPSVETNRNGFHTEYLALRSTLPRNSTGTEQRTALRKQLQALTFDCASLWDRTFGGTTLVVHVEGATRPGSPNEPEYVKADVYFPGHMVREEPYTSIVVSDIVQRFIRDIGIPTIERFNRCARILWNMPSYSGPIPAPYPMQTTSPIASPPGSSVFTYYGKQNRAAVQVIDSDSDDDEKLQLTGFKTENTALRTQLEQVHQSLKRADVLANSHQREQPLRVAHINGFSSQPCPITPANPRTIPRTPERTLSSQSSKTLTQNSFISPTTRRTPSRHKSGHSNSLTSARSVTPTRVSPENQYAAFIDANGLTEFHPAIDLVRRRVVMFNWKDELLNLGIAQDLVADLMSAMNSYSETERSFPSESSFG